MTKEDFAEEYIAREKAANATPQGADCRAILTALAKEHGWTYEAARDAVIDHTIAGPC